MTGVMTRGRLHPNSDRAAMPLAHLKTLAGIHPPGRVRLRHVIRPIENAGPTGGYGRFDPAFRPGAQTLIRPMHGTADPIPCVHHILAFIDRHRKGISAPQSPQGMTSRTMPVSMISIARGAKKCVIPIYWSNYAEK